MVSFPTAKIVLDRHKTDTHLIKIRVTYKRKSKLFPTKTKMKLSKEELSTHRTKNAKEAIKLAEVCLVATQEILSEMGRDFDWKIFEDRYLSWFFGKSTVGSRDTMRSLHDEYVATRTLEPKTVKIYASAMNWVDRFRPEVRICDIGPGFVASFLTFFREAHRTQDGVDVSENTVRIYLRYLNSLFNYAIKKGYMKCENPVVTDRECALSSIPRQKATLSEEEWDRFFRHEPSDAAETFAKDFFIASMQMCGANIGDILRLRNRDIAGNVIVFSRHKTRKTYIDIKVPLTAPLEAFLRKYGAVNPDNPKLLVLPFLAGATDSNNENNRIQKVVKRVNAGLKTFCDSAGIRRVTSYNARHTFATFGLASGLSIGELQKFLGHSSANTTQVYLSSLTEKSIEKGRNFLESLVKE